MKYTVTLSRIGLAQANHIVKVLSGMGYGIPEISETPEELSDNEPRKRHGIGVVLKNNGMKFISISEATDWLRRSCNVTCSDCGLKRAIEQKKSYHGFEFCFDNEVDLPGAY